MSRDAFSSDSRQPDAVSRERARKDSLAAEPITPERPEPSAIEVREPGCLKPERDDSPRAHILGDRTFLLRESELHTLGELGRFRVAAAADLARFAYASDNARMERDLRRLREAGLVSERTLPVSGRKTLRVLALTKTGKRIVEKTGRLPENQKIYQGIVKPREAKHDAELYRLFHTESERIQKEGGKPLRVVLDYELKRDLNRDRAQLGDRQKDPQEMESLAARYGLAVVDGKIPLPDMRIEYQNADLELRRVDLELATRHYRPRGVATKAKAGFSLYSHREDASRLRRILDEQELTARILTL
jgi:hypothetical protein